jgi:hypothetical protein
VPIRLVESGVTDTRCLPLINIPVHGRFFTTRATESSVVVVEGNDEDRINSSATPIRVRLLQELLGRSFAVINDNYLKRAGAVSLIELEIVPVPIIIPRAAGA